LSWRTVRRQSLLTTSAVGIGICSGGRSAEIVNHFGICGYLGGYKQLSGKWRCELASDLRGVR